MKTATVALVVKFNDQSPSLVETLSDDREITVFESAVEAGELDPLAQLVAHREAQVREDEEFGNYVEELLSQPFLKPDVQEHAVQWLKSKTRIEQFQKSEAEAAQIISNYAYKIFCDAPSKTDFLLVGMTAQVRIRVFVLNRDAQRAA